MKKLKNQDGVSFVFALVALLVASVVSITILSAAVTTVKRVSDDQKTQQNRLDLTSAAQLVRDEMKKTTVTTTDAPDSVPTYTGDFADIVEAVMKDEAHTGGFTVDDGSSAVTVIVTMTDNKDLTFALEAGKEKAYLTMTAQSSTSESSAGKTTVTSWKTAVITGITEVSNEKEAE